MPLFRAKAVLDELIAGFPPRAPTYRSTSPKRSTASAQASILKSVPLNARFIPFSLFFPVLLGQGATRPSQGRIKALAVAFSAEGHAAMLVTCLLKL